MLLKGDMIDKKIQAILDLYNDKLDETDEGDIIFYCELRDYAEKSGGLFYFYRNDYYMVIHFIDDEEFFIAPIENAL